MQQNPVASTAKALDTETIHQVWDAAGHDLRCYIALALNCGYYAIDIANLKYEHLQDGYIVTSRHKTGVPTRHKLWPVTRQRKRAMNTSSRW